MGGTMNRRWSVALVIVMLAALAPSAALTAPPEKPGDAITGILWEAGGGQRVPVHQLDHRGLHRREGSLAVREYPDEAGGSGLPPSRRPEPEP